MSWICKGCETENSDDVSVCEVCNTPRPKIKKRKTSKIETTSEETKKTDVVSIKLKVLFICLFVIYNYFACFAGIGWLVFSIILTMLTALATIPNDKDGKIIEGEKKYRIGIFVYYSVIMFTIITPLPWWSVLLAIFVPILVAYKFNW